MNEFFDGMSDYLDDHKRLGMITSWSYDYHMLISWIDFITVSCPLQLLRDQMSRESIIMIVFMRIATRLGSHHRERRGGLDSLVRMLLGVELIQPKLIQLLLEKLPDYSTELTVSRR